MRIRWRGLELPSRVVRDESVSNNTYGRFTIEPFEQGYGTTIGNALRRVLLSSLEGAAVTSVKIDGVSHEFASIDGVLEDVTEIILNIKGILLVLEEDGSKTLSVQRDTAGEVRAGDITADASVKIKNPNHLIATLTADVPFQLEMTAKHGRGYVTGSENRTPEQAVDVLPIDSIYSPVRRVRYRTQDMRVGHRTNYDRLFLEIWTNGTVLPEDALVEAAQILRKHLNPFVMYGELGEEVVSPAPPRIEAEAGATAAVQDILDKPISILNLSVRASNCLEAGNVSTIRQLVALTDSELLRLRSFGKTSLHEVHRKLVEMGLSTGLKFDEERNPVPGSDAMEAGATDPVDNQSVAAESGPMEAFTMGD